jgi:hypothetical protein
MLWAVRHSRAAPSAIYSIKSDAWVASIVIPRKLRCEIGGTVCSSKGLAFGTSKNIFATVPFTDTSASHL